MIGGNQIRFWLQIAERQRIINTTERWCPLAKVKRRFLQILLACIPAIALTVCTPLANRVEPRIAGLPFLLAYIAIWILLTPLFMWAVYRLEVRS